MRAAGSWRFGPSVVVGLLAVALAWGLSRYGGTETPALYRLFLLTAVPAALALLLTPPRPVLAGDWILAGVGLVLLLGVALAPTLAATGYAHWALGWMVLWVAYRMGDPPAPSSRPELARSGPRTSSRPEPERSGPPLSSRPEPERSGGGAEGSRRPSAPPMSSRPEPKRSGGEAEGSRGSEGHPDGGLGRRDPSTPPPHGGSARDDSGARPHGGSARDDGGARPRGRSPRDHGPPGSGRTVTRATRLLVFALVALGALEALYGLEQVIGGDLGQGSGEHLEGMATGTFVNRNHYAGFLNLVLPLAVGALYAAYARRWGRRSRTEMVGLAWTVLLASAFIGVAVLLSRSRGGTVTLLVTIAFMGTLLALGRRTSRRGLSSVASATLAGLIVALGLAVGLDALLARFAEIEQTEARLAVYGDTLGMIADAPLAGVGPGMYRWRFRPYQTADLGSRYDHAHNDYLETAAEWGLPLALAFWVFVLVRLRGAVVVALGSKDPWRRGLALGVAGSIASILLHSLFDFNLQIPANLMVFAAVLGMAWGLSPHLSSRPEPERSGGGAEGSRRPSGPPMSSRPEPQRSGGGAEGSQRPEGRPDSGLGRRDPSTPRPGGHSARDDRDDGPDGRSARDDIGDGPDGRSARDDIGDGPGGRSARDDRSERHASRGGMGLALAGVLLLALLFAAWRTWPRLEAVELARGAAELADLERGVELDPTNPEIHFLLAIAHRDHPEHRDLEAARRHLGRATALNPYAWRYWLELSRLEELAGRPAPAAEALERAVALNPRRGDYRWRLANFHLRQGARQEAFEELAAALRLDSTLERPAFHLLLKAGATWSEIEHLWPEPPHNRLALLELACRALPAGATEPAPELLERLWRSAVDAPEPPPVESATFFVSHLLERGRAERARSAWIELSEANDLEDPAYAAGENLLWNGGFELSVVVPSPLAWRLARGDGFRMMRYPIDGSDGNALRIDFEGANVDFRHLSQRVVVESRAALRLSARWAARQLTTESGLYLEVLAGGRPIAATEPILGTVPWREVEVVFDTPSFEGSDGGTLELRFRRRRSHRIAGKIEGTALVDDIRLAPVESGEPPSVIPTGAGAERRPSGGISAAVEPLMADERVVSPDKSVAPADKVGDKSVAPGNKRVAPAVGGRLVGVLVRLATGQGRGEGRLVIVSQEGVEVVWDGVEVGETGDGGRLVIDGIPPGDYTLGLAKDGFRAVGQRISIEPGDNRLERFLEPLAPLGPPEREPRASAGEAAEPGPAAPPAAEPAADEPAPGGSPVEVPAAEDSVAETPSIETPLVEAPPDEAPATSATVGRETPGSPLPDPAAPAETPAQTRAEAQAEAAAGPERSSPVSGSRAALLVVLALLLAVAYVLVRRRFARRAAARASADTTTSGRIPSFLTDLRQRERVLERQSRRRRVIDAEASEVEVGVESPHERPSEGESEAGDREDREPRPADSDT